MALPQDLNSREHTKFREKDGGTAVAVTLNGETVVTDAAETTDFEGGPVTVGTTAVEITFSGTTQSILLTSDITNTGTVYLGKSNVTNAGANAMTQMEPGGSVGIKLDDFSNAIYLVSDTVAQNVFKMSLI